MALFYWHNQGRLGNLLFQYSAILKCTAVSDYVVAFHNDVFDLVKSDARFVVIKNRGRFARHLNFRVNQLSSWATGSGLVGLISPHVTAHAGYETESEFVKRGQGRIKRLSVVEGFFQYAQASSGSLSIREHLLQEAHRKLFDLTAGQTSVAVHVRLTDYGTWSVYGKPGVVVPIDWYISRMRDLRRRLDKPLFVVFSDDLDKVKTLDLGADVTFFEGASGIEDFTVMSLCDHAIISPSSFAWWSVLSARRTGKIIIAPTFWAGFKSRVWYPPTIVSEHIEYFAVQSN